MTYPERPEVCSRRCSWAKGKGGGLVPKHAVENEAFDNGVEWTCLQCGETHASTFEACWNCGTGRRGERRNPHFEAAVESTYIPNAAEDDLVKFPGAIGITHDGEPIYPVVGYKADGTAVTADQAADYRHYNSGTNTLAIVSFILAFVLAPLAIPFGHAALSQIKRTGEQGSGFAIAGLILGYVSLAGIIFWMVSFG